jgi:hypothetical protein
LRRVVFLGDPKNSSSENIIIERSKPTSDLQIKTGQLSFRRLAPLGRDSLRPGLGLARPADTPFSLVGRVHHRPTIC